MQRIAPQGNYVPVAFTRDRRAFPAPSTEPVMLRDLYRPKREGVNRAAVAYDNELEAYLVFDLEHVHLIAEPPHFVADRWWMTLTKPEAIARALWFARD